MGQPPATSNPDDVFVIGGVGFPVSGAPVAFELCAGTAALTKALGDVGFIAIAVDSVENILMQRDFFFRLDLSDPVVQRMLRFCTQLPRALAQIGVHEPPPARSEAHPAGLPGLASFHTKLAARVSAATIIFDCTAALFHRLSSMKKQWSIENPTRSYLWMLPSMRCLASAGVVDVVFDSCMHGRVKKSTLFRCSRLTPLSALAETCDGKHAHAPWTLNTGCATPPALCAKIASLVASLVAAPLQCQPNNSRAVCALVSADRAGAAVQPRGTKAPPVVSEFKSVFFAPIPHGSLTLVSAPCRQTLKYDANLPGFSLPLFMSHPADLAWNGCVRIHRQCKLGRSDPWHCL